MFLPQFGIQFLSIAKKVRGGILLWCMEYTELEAKRQFEFFRNFSFREWVLRISLGVYGCIPAASAASQCLRCECGKVGRNKSLYSDSNRLQLTGNYKQLRRLYCAFHTSQFRLIAVGEILKEIVRSEGK
jgi:hypothetical protein